MDRAPRLVRTDSPIRSRLQSRCHRSDRSNSEQAGFDRAYRVFFHAPMLFGRFPCRCVTGDSILLAHRPVLWPHASARNGDARPSQRRPTGRSIIAGAATRTGSRGGFCDPMPVPQNAVNVPSARHRSAPILSITRVNSIKCRRAAGFAVIKLPHPDLRGGCSLADRIPGPRVNVICYGEPLGQPLSAGESHGRRTTVHHLTSSIARPILDERNGGWDRPKHPRQDKARHLSRRAANSGSIDPHAAAEKESPYPCLWTSRPVPGHEVIRRPWWEHRDVAEALVASTTSVRRL